MKNQENEKTEKKFWFENYRERTYKSINYKMFEKTPQEAEDKIKSFIDKLSKRYITGKLPICEVLTEESPASLFDVWLFTSHISERDIIMNTEGFILHRGKNEKQNKYGYRIRYIL